MEEDRTIREFLGDQPRADELQEMRELLIRRLKGLTEEAQKTPPPARAALEARVATLKVQIAALEQEELITRFVEESVRVTLAMGSVVDGETETY